MKVAHRINIREQIREYERQDEMASPGISEARKSGRVPIDHRIINTSRSRERTASMYGEVVEVGSRTCAAREILLPDD